ncbi:hypothetical protein KKB54_03305 [bacterium]|nr:hypothetical protein [bacterium]MBU0899825.1 hypothetical protein [bacterium]MBU1152373.1 hypothetical protein [bacterium]MBU1782322.1 hypothetical protein [bacterium]MBU2599834.1 hypothetical protein [bacterium]
MDLEKIKNLVELMEKGNLIELEVEEGKTKVFLKKYSREEDQENKKERSITEDTEEKELRLEEDLIELTSPMVGVIKLSNLKKESRINKGDVLYTVEAMKHKNEIRSDYEGIILDLYVDDNTPVEYGQKIFLIKKIK